MIFGMAIIIIALCFMYVLLRLERLQETVQRHYMKCETLNTRVFIAEEDIKNLYNAVLPGSDRFDDELEEGILRSMSLIERKRRNENV